eukprot:Hpha_TRINITY_DN26676_c0_g1::TRINITY_DN26676_c0_g1_i1::g.86117::m.86117
MASGMKVPPPAVGRRGTDRASSTTTSSKSKTPPASTRRPMANTGGTRRASTGAKPPPQQPATRRRTLSPSGGVPESKLTKLSRQCLRDVHSKFAELEASLRGTIDPGREVPPAEVKVMRGLAEGIGTLAGSCADLHRRINAAVAVDPQPAPSERGEMKEVSGTAVLVQEVCDQITDVATEARTKVERVDTEGLNEFIVDTLANLRKELRELSTLRRKAAPRTAAEGRFGQGVGEADVDRGWTCFFSEASCAKNMTQTVQRALGTQGGFVVCKGCGVSVQRRDQRRHALRCKTPGPDIQYEEMTAEWVVRQAKEISEQHPFVAMYTLESPLRYEVNTAMRGGGEELESKRDFAYTLHRALMTLPPFEGTVFRAVNFKAHAEHYATGAILTMPHPTSTTEDPVVARDALGGGNGGAATGTLLIMRVKTARRISAFSCRKAEREVVVPANTQFRVMGRPDVGVLRLLEAAVEGDLSDVTVYELQEIDFHHWGRFSGLLTEAERARNSTLIKAAEATELKKWELRRHPVSLAPCANWYPLSTEMPEYAKGKALVEHALDVAGNAGVVSLCLANFRASDQTQCRTLNRSLRYALLNMAVVGQVDSVVVLLNKGADVRSLSDDMLTADLGIIACSCKPEVLVEAREAL